MKKTVYLSLGSNVGDRRANLRNAVGKLLNLGNLLAVSSFYETEPVEFTDQPWFLNCAVALQTELKAEDFLRSANPPYGGYFQYGRPMKGHGWTPLNQAELVRAMADAISRNAPAGSDNSWKY